jgi:hypothetical protein
MAKQSTRSALYRLARTLGDIQAVENGTYAKRRARRAVYRQTNGWLRSLFKAIGLK